MKHIIITPIAFIFFISLPIAFADTSSSKEMTIPSSINEKVINDSMPTNPTGISRNDSSMISDKTIQLKKADGRIIEATIKGQDLKTLKNGDKLEIILEKK